MTGTDGVDMRDPLPAPKKRQYKGRVNIANATLQELCRRVTELEKQVERLTRDTGQKTYQPSIYVLNEADRLERWSDEWQ